MRKIRFFIAIFFLLVWTGLASASTIAQMEGTEGYNLFYSSSQTGVGQTFTATTERYDYISVFLYPSSESYSDTTISFSLFNDPFTQPATLTWTSNELPALLQDAGRLNIDISTFDFTSGSTYSFALFNDTNEWLVRYAKSDLYTGGSMYLGYDGSFSITNTASDLKFQITAHPTPIPSTLALFSTGLFALITALIRKFKQN